MDHYCHFRLNDIHMCLPIHQVQQVYDTDDIHPVPTSPRAILGLVNLRGLVVTALDMRVVLQLPTDAPPPCSKLVAVANGHPVALVVDEVLGVQTVGADGDADSIRPLPPNLQAHLRSLASGVLCREDALVLVVDAERIVAAGRAA